MDVTPTDFAPFYGKQSGLEDFITGAKPISELPGDVRAKMQSFSPWATSLRGCGESLQLGGIPRQQPGGHYSATVTL